MSFKRGRLKRVAAKRNGWDYYFSSKHHHPDESSLRGVCTATTTPPHGAGGTATPLHLAAEAKNSSSFECEKKGTAVAVAVKCTHERQPIRQLDSLDIATRTIGKHSNIGAVVDETVLDGREACTGTNTTGVSRDEMNSECDQTNVGNDSAKKSTDTTEIPAEKEGLPFANLVECMEPSLLTVKPGHDGTPHGAVEQQPCTLESKNVKPHRNKRERQPPSSTSTPSKVVESAKRSSRRSDNTTTTLLIRNLTPSDIVINSLAPTSRSGMTLTDQHLRILERFRGQYKRVPRTKKLAVAMKIIDQLKLSGARFLERKQRLYKKAPEASILPLVCHILQDSAPKAKATKSTVTRNHGEHDSRVAKKKPHVVSPEPKYSEALLLVPTSKSSSSSPSPLSLSAAAAPCKVLTPKAPKPVRPKLAPMTSTTAGSTPTTPGDTHHHETPYSVSVPKEFLLLGPLAEATLTTTQRSPQDEEPQAPETQALESSPTRGRYQKVRRRDVLLPTATNVPPQDWRFLEKTQGLSRTLKQSGKVVLEPHPHDVLFGKGNTITTHVGNWRYRKLVWELKEEYSTARKPDKPRIAERIIQAIESLDPPGRFLIEQNPSDNNNDTADDDHVPQNKCLNNLEGAGGLRFVDAPRRRVMEKIAQALRERKWKARPTTAAGALGEDFCRHQTKRRLEEAIAQKEREKNKRIKENHCC